jgi:hypothetical protein
MALSLWVHRHDHDARCFPVQTVDESRLRISGAGAFFETVAVVFRFSLYAEKAALLREN